MKAIVIAAGLGSRLDELTKDRPKCKLLIQGKALIEHQFDIFRDLGVHEIVVVTGYKAEQLEYPGVRRYFNDNFRNNNILFSLMYASSEFDDDLIISYSDIIYKREVVEALMRAPGDISVVTDVDWKSKYINRKHHPEEQAEKVAIQDGSITKIGKHLSSEAANGEFIGLMKLSKQGAEIFKKTFEEIAALSRGNSFQQASLVDRAYVTDLLQELIDRGYAVQPVQIHGGWREIDTEEDLINAGRLVWLNESVRSPDVDGR